MIEAVWIAISFAGAAITGGALIDARGDVEVIRLDDLRRKLTGSVRGIVARATVRRECFRLGSQLALLAVALPMGRELRIAALMTVPVFILLNSLSDRRMRHEVLAASQQEIAKERNAMEDRLNARADERALTATANADHRAEVASDEADARAVVASDQADARASEAHDRADEHAAGAEQRAKVVTKRANDIKVTADETAVEVHDIHDVTVKGDA